MKTPRFPISIVMAAAIGTVASIITVAQAKPQKRSGWLRSPEREAADLTSIHSRHARFTKFNDAVRLVTVPAEYPRYRLIDLGTLGGENGGVWGLSAQLNNHGQVIAQLGTAVPDPYDPNCFNFDCLVWHGVVRDAQGVTELGVLPGGYNTVPVWISETGRIAGLSQNGLIDPLTDFPQFRAVLWNPDHTMKDLGTLGGNSSAAFSLNSRGQVVGTALNATPEDPGLAEFIYTFPGATEARAFLWERGVMRDLGTLGGKDASALVVNERNQIVGASYTGTTPNDTTGVPTVHPFLWQNGTMRDLGSLGGTLAIPGSISFLGGGRVLNESGEVAGTSTLAGDEVLHGFLWSKGRMIDLGTLGGSTSEAVAINNKGQVVGRARLSDTPVVRHPFVWEDGHMTDLGMVAQCINGTAFSINSADQIVGSLGACTGNPFTAFYVEIGKPMVDLNTLVTPASTIHLNDGWNINDRGEILALGVLPDGSEHAVLLAPISH